MSRLVVILIFFLTWLSSCSDSLKGDLIISDVNIVDVETGDIIPNQDVAIIGDFITTITPSKSNRNYVSDRIINGRNKYLIPGLCDMHTHTWWGYEDFFPLLLANGVTGIREMFGNLEAVKSIRKKIKNGDIQGPDIISAGEIICGAPPSLKTCVVAKTPEEGREYVRDQKANGADFIKTYNMLEKDVYLAISDESKKQDIVLAGHIPLKVLLPEALDAGHASIEHFYGILEYISDTAGLRKIDEARNTRFNYLEYIKRANHIVETYDDSKEEAVIKLLAENEAWICPTFTVHKGFIRTYEFNFEDERKLYMPEYAINNWFSQKDSVLSETDLKNLKVEEDYYDMMISLSKPMIEQGIRFLAGSDYSNPYTYPGFSLHEELQIFVEEAEFTPLEALQTATINPALYLEHETKIGTVEVGKRASLVLLNANPLEDITNTREIEGVVLRGDYLEGDSLRADIDTIAAKNKLPKISDVIKPLIVEQGIEAGIAEYRQISKNSPDQYNFDREQLNSLGYNLLEMEKPEEAIRIFELNIEMYPDYANGYDSLGDAYLTIGDTTKTIKVWEKAIELGSATTKERLKNLLKN